MDDRRVREVLLKLLEARGAERSICPSEVAPALDPKDWRSLLPKGGDVVRSPATASRIVVLQGGEAVDPSVTPGPLRLRLRDDPDF